MAPPTRAGQHRIGDSSSSSSSKRRSTDVSSPSNGKMIMAGNQAMLMRPAAAAAATTTAAAPKQKTTAPAQQGRVTVVPSMVATISEFVTAAIGAVLFARKIYPQDVYTPTKISYFRRGKEVSMISYRLTGPTDDVHIQETLSQLDSVIDALRRGYLSTVSLCFALSKRSISNEGAIPLLECWQYDFNYESDEGPARVEQTQRSIYDLLATQQLTLKQQPPLPSGFYIQLRASLNACAPQGYKPAGFFERETVGERWVIEAAPGETPTFQTYRGAGMEECQASSLMARARTNAYRDPEGRKERMEKEDRLLFDVAATGSGPSTQRTPFDVLGFNALLGEDEDDDGGMGSRSGDNGLGRPCALVRPRTRTEEPVPSHILQEWEKKRPKDVYGEDLVAKLPAEIFKAPQPKKIGGTGASVNEKLTQHTDSRPVVPSQFTWQAQQASPQSPPQASQAFTARAPTSLPSSINVQCDCGLLGKTSDDENDDELAPCADCGIWLHRACYGHISDLQGGPFAPTPMASVTSSAEQAIVLCWTCILAQRRALLLAANSSTGTGSEASAAEDKDLEDDRYCALSTLSQLRRALYKLSKLGTWPSGPIEPFAGLIGARDDDVRVAEKTAQGLQDRLLEEGFLVQQGSTGTVQICDDEDELAYLRQRFFMPGGGVEAEYLSEGWRPQGGASQLEGRAAASQGEEGEVGESQRSAAASAGLGDSQRDDDDNDQHLTDGQQLSESQQLDDSQQLDAPSTQVSQQHHRVFSSLHQGHASLDPNSQASQSQGQSQSQLLELLLPPVTGSTAADDQAAYDDHGSTGEDFPTPSDVGDVYNSRAASALNAALGGAEGGHGSSAAPGGGGGEDSLDFWSQQAQQSQSQSLAAAQESAAAGPYRTASSPIAPRMTSGFTSAILAPAAMSRSRLASASSRTGSRRMSMYGRRSSLIATERRKRSRTEEGGEEEEGEEETQTVAGPSRPRGQQKGKHKHKQKEARSSAPSPSPSASASASASTSAAAAAAPPAPASMAASFATLAEQNKKRKRGGQGQAAASTSSSQPAPLAHQHQHQPQHLRRSARQPKPPKELYQ